MGPTFERAPVFIVGCPKSGTTLLLSLLDGHSALAVMPSEINYFRYTTHRTEFPKRKLAHEKHAARIVPLLLRDLFFLRVQDPEGRERLRTEYGYHQTHDLSAIDPAAFGTALRATAIGAAAPADHPALYRALFAALLMAQGGDPDRLRSLHPVEKSPLQEEHAEELSRWFPGARFLHLVRNPYAVVCALRRVETGAWRPQATPRYPALGYALRRLAASHRHAAHHTRTMPGRYRVVRYEDLILEPAATLQGLCSFLEIDWEPVLMAPTLLGRPWFGNSMFTDRLDGISTLPLEHWRADLSPLEVALVNRFFAAPLVRYGYPRLVPSGNVWRRRPDEPPRHYLHNRLLLLRPSRHL